MNKTATPDVAEMVATRLDALAGRLTELVEVSRGLALNHVLFSGTKLIPDVGHVTLEFSVPMASVLINATSTADMVTAVAGSPAAGAPQHGEGVFAVDVGGMLCMPMVGPTLTVYGSPGDLVAIAVFSRLMPPVGA